jgi:hypothetical protein
MITMVKLHMNEYATSLYKQIEDLIEPFIQIDADGMKVALVQFYLDHQEMNWEDLGLIMDGAVHLMLGKGDVQFGAYLTDSIAVHAKQYNDGTARPEAEPTDVPQYCDECGRAIYAIDETCPYCGKLTGYVRVKEE